jgi:DegV family protein with EDD domain
MSEKKSGLSKSGQLMDRSSQPVKDYAKKPYAVVTDSASDVPKDYAQKHNINIVPLYIHYKGLEFRDGLDIQSGKIYSLQKEKKTIFMTSSPSPKDFVYIYTKLLEKYERIISIHLSSKLSAVIKSAIIAAELLKAEKRITVFDSLSGTMGTGFMAITAAKAAGKEVSFEKMTVSLQFLKENIMLFGTMNTLRYLKSSGRAPVIAWIVTAAFRIKPLLGIKNGVVEMIGITVTRWASLAAITGMVIRRFRREKWVLVSVVHTLSKTEAIKIMKKLQGSLNCVESMIVDCTPVVGAHTGPGLIGIIITRLDRQTAELFI